MMMMMMMMMMLVVFNSSLKQVLIHRTEGHSFYIFLQHEWILHSSQSAGVLLMDKISAKKHPLVGRLWFISTMAQTVEKS